MDGSAWFKGCGIQQFLGFVFHSAAEAYLNILHLAWVQPFKRNGMQPKHRYSEVTGVNIGTEDSKWI